MAQYGKPSYWDERYTKDPEPFDWYQRYFNIKEIINQHVQKEDSILMAGCGNSRMTEEMYDEGFTSITNIDISRVVIEQNIDRYKEKPGIQSLQWQQMNVTALDFPDESFDTVISKATIDAIMCGENSTANVGKALNEISRVLKPNGVFIMISYGTTESRLPHLEKEDRYYWKVKVLTVNKPTITAAALPAADDANGVHYIFICKKAGPSSADEQS